jgi:hypothetical protein
MSNLWESKALTEAANLCTQIQSRIEVLCEEEQQLPSQLPDSLISTKSLWLIAIAYNSLYEHCLDHELIQTGNPKPNHKMQ